MAKQWSPEEEALMTTHYPVAKSVDMVAEMLGRTRSGVVKKALAMGLKRPDLHEESIKRLQAVLGDVPMDSGEIAAALGMKRSATNDLLRRLHDEGICHIAEYRHAHGRGKDTPLWVAGDGVNAMTDFMIERQERAERLAAHAAIPFKPFRDPFIAAFYGEAA